ncbi:cytochrome c biogenesis protein CcsA [Methanohalobium sp.]|uniref:cytochrome c biogenesis protein CcsA n=1 Tax=Methanohalobium sp. TaxID=2837493 RepID=UPI0025F053B2|nr:cytochrome c biogenesis protein CcsA [Methanohalobium sp.]
MNIGMILIWVAFTLCLGAGLTSLLHYFKGSGYLKTLSRRLEVGATGAVTIAVFLLSYYLFHVQTAYSYVYQHSSADLTWYYRLSALWAGQEGSFLLWGWFILVILLVLKYTMYKRQFSGTRLYELTVTISLFIASVFLLLLVLKNPFSMYHAVPSGTIELTNWNPFVTAFQAPYGQGMNPLLRNPWMAIHPPVLFIGYAAITIPFASAFAGLILDDNRWTEIATHWMRFSWLFLTLGIGLGGFWAYEVLGWGAWYWSWDPVETSSLIPWITSTAYLHTQIHSSNKIRNFAPALAIFSFVLVVFATFVTRSGIWASVHSWQDFTPTSFIVAIFLISLLGSSVVMLVNKYME